MTRMLLLAVATWLGTVGCASRVVETGTKCVVAVIGNSDCVVRACETKNEEGTCEATFYQFPASGERVECDACGQCDGAAEEVTGKCLGGVR